MASDRKLADLARHGACRDSYRRPDDELINQRLSAPEKTPIFHNYENPWMYWLFGWKRFYGSEDDGTSPWRSVAPRGSLTH